MNPMLLKALVEGGAEAKKEFTAYVNNLQEQIDLLSKEQLDDYKIIVDNLQEELNMIKDLYNNDQLSADEKVLLIEKMEILNDKLSIELAKKSEYLKSEKTELQEKKENAFQLAAEVLTGIIPFTAFARAVNKIKKDKKN